MDLVRLSITGGLALVGVLTLASLAHHGQAEPASPPALAQPVPLPSPARETIATHAPILVDPSAPGPIVRLSSDPAYGGLPLFPAAPTSTRPATFDERWRGGPSTWDAYVEEASRRFGVPPSWITSVMRAESRGLQYLDGRPITSPKGAMGLMQVMPETYAELRARYGFGPDPYDPHDNILAGAAYIREMAERFGAPGFAAAYNAGPGRYADFLARGRSLPGETQRYLASVAPAIGGATVAQRIDGAATVKSAVRDLTATALGTSPSNGSVVAPRSPADSPLFVTAARNGIPTGAQPQVAPSEGLFVVLATSDRRRTEVSPAPAEN